MPHATHSGRGFKIATRQHPVLASSPVAEAVLRAVEVQHHGAFYERLLQVRGLLGGAVAAVGGVVSGVTGTVGGIVNGALGGGSSPATTPAAAYTPPAYTPPAYTPPAYTPPAYTPPAYTPPAYTPPAYTPPAYTPPAYTPPAYTPPATTQAAPQPVYTPPATTQQQQPAPVATTPRPVANTTPASNPDPVTSPANNGGNNTPATSADSGNAGNSGGTTGGNAGGNDASQEAGTTTGNAGGHAGGGNLAVSSAAAASDSAAASAAAASSSSSLDSMQSALASQQSFYNAGGAITTVLPNGQTQTFSGTAAAAAAQSSLSVISASRASVQSGMSEASILASEASVLATGGVITTTNSRGMPVTLSGTAQASSLASSASVLTATRTGPTASGRPTGTGSSGDSGVINDRSTNGGVIGGAVGGVLAALLLLGLGFWFFKRRNNKDEKNRHESFFSPGAYEEYPPEAAFTGFPVSFDPARPAVSPPATGFSLFPERANLSAPPPVSKDGRDARSSPSRSSPAPSRSPGAVSPGSAYTPVVRALGASQGSQGPAITVFGNSKGSGGLALSKSLEQTLPASEGYPTVGSIMFPATADSPTIRQVVPPSHAASPSDTSIFSASSSVLHAVGADGNLLPRSSSNSPTSLMDSGSPSTVRNFTSTHQSASGYTPRALPPSPRDEDPFRRASPHISDQLLGEHRRLSLHSTDSEGSSNSGWSSPTATAFSQRSPMQPPTALAEPQVSGQTSWASTARAAVGTVFPHLAPPKPIVLRHSQVYDSSTVIVESPTIGWSKLTPSYAAGLSPQPSQVSLDSFATAQSGTPAQSLVEDNRRNSVDSVYSDDSGEDDPFSDQLTPRESLAAMPSNATLKTAPASRQQIRREIDLIRDSTSSSSTTTEETVRDSTQTFESGVVDYLGLRADRQTGDFSSRVI